MAGVALGTWPPPPSLCVAGVALTALGLALVARLGPVIAAALCVAGVAPGDSDRRFVWQTWHLATSMCILRGMPGTYGTGQALVARLGPVVTAAACVAGVALGDIDRRFAWQACHLACSLRARLGVALVALGWLWCRAWRHRPSLCVSGVALGDIVRHFAWQAWHLATSTVTLRGRHSTYGAGLALVARLSRVVAAAVCVAGVALGDSDRRFAWQAWCLATSTCILRGRRGAYGTGLALVARWSPRRFSWQALFMAWGMFCVRPHYARIQTYTQSYTRMTHVNKYRHTNKSLTRQSFIHTFHPLMSLSCLSHSIFTSFFVIYWKKLTCGVLRHLKFG